MSKTYEIEHSHVGPIHSFDPITAFGQDHVNFDNIIPCPNVIEEDSSGGNLSLASDKDFDDFDDSMTIDPTLFAEYDGDVPHLPALDNNDDDVDDDIMGMAQLRSPFSCRFTECETKKRKSSGVCFDDYDDDNDEDYYHQSPSKRSHFDFFHHYCDTILPPLPEYEDCDPSLVNSILVSDEESEMEQEQQQQEQIILSDERSVDNTTAADEEEEIQHPTLQLLLEEQLRCLITTIRESEKTRAELLSQVEHLPSLYSPYQNGILADTDLDTFFDTQDSADETMAYAFHKLYAIRTNKKNVPKQQQVFTTDMR